MAERYDRGAHLTLTTNPKIHSSTIEAAETLMESFGELRRWLFRDVSAPWAPTRPGRSLPYIRVLEWTDSGLPHLHVVFFGVSDLAPKSAVSEYMRDRTGYIVHLDTIVSRGEGAAW